MRLSLEAVSLSAWRDPATTGRTRTGKTDHDLLHLQGKPPGAGARDQQPPGGAGPGTRVLLGAHEHAQRVRAD
jgi:hypothetical protein